MIYRNLGKSGLKVSVLSFGSWLTFAKQIEGLLLAIHYELHYFCAPPRPTYVCLKSTFNIIDRSALTLVFTEITSELPPLPPVNKSLFWQPSGMILNRLVDDAERRLDR